MRVRRGGRVDCRPKEDYCTSDGYGFQIRGRSGERSPDFPRLNARFFEPGIADGDLRTELFDVLPQSKPGVACQEQCQPGIQQGRTPTPEWEMAFLGLGQSRTRALDPDPNSDLAVWRIYNRPFKDEVSGPWIQQFLITQETYRQFNGPNADRWEEEMNG